MLVDIFYRDEIDEFIESMNEVNMYYVCMNEVKHVLRVVYYVKCRDYGCKVIIIVRNQVTSPTLIQLIKLNIL